MASQKPTREQLEKFIATARALADEVESGALVPGTGRTTVEFEQVETGPHCVIGHLGARLGALSTGMDDCVLRALGLPGRGSPGFSMSPSLEHAIDRLWRENDRGFDNPAKNTHVYVASSLRLLAETAKNVYGDVNEQA